MPPPAPPPPRKPARGALRFVAGTCVFSAWLTLVLSVLGAFFCFTGGATVGAALRSLSPSPAVSPLPATPSPGGLGSSPGATNSDGSEPIPGLDTKMPGGLGGGGGGGLPMGDMLGMFTPVIGAALFASGLFTLVTGVVGWVILLGMGQACYLLMDLEEQSFRHSEVLQILVARLGGAR